jgi:hypothetical protein
MVDQFDSNSTSETFDGAGPMSQSSLCKPSQNGGDNTVKPTLDRNPTRRLVVQLPGVTGTPFYFAYLNT